MKTKYVITAIALSLLAGGTLNLNAQTNTNSLADQWNTLRASEGPSFNPASAEAGAIATNLIAQPSISLDEGGILWAHFTSVGGNPAWLAVARTIQSKSPFAAAAVKSADRDPSGWTTAMIQQGCGWAINAALLPTAPSELKSQVWEVMHDKPLKNESWVRFFKEYRATLPKSEQLAVTAAQKALLVAKMQRSDFDNAWLAEASADLIALQLDQ